jgi:colicin import membrane protein
MRPVEFAPEAIIQAGQELRDAGRNITGFALRQKVGGGNPSRLKQVWDEHLASQSVTKRNLWLNCLLRWQKSWLSSLGR